MNIMYFVVCVLLNTNTPVRPFLCVFVAEISNLIVVTKERAPAPGIPGHHSFPLILKEEIELVPLPIFLTFSCVLKALQLLQYLLTLIHIKNVYNTIPKETFIIQSIVKS